MIKLLVDYGAEMTGVFSSVVNEKEALQYCLSDLDPSFMADLPLRACFKVVGQDLKMLVKVTMIHSCYEIYF
jgi:hypothetical protein